MTQTLGRRPDPLNLVSYDEWRPTATTGLIGLQHSNEFIGRQIQNATESDYSHAFMVGWWFPERRIFPSGNWVLYLTESYGPESRGTSLRWRAQKISGLLDIYRLRPEIAALVDFDKAWANMLRFCGQNYPEDWIARDLLAIATGQVIHPIPDSDDPEVPRHCSGALHWAYRMAGMPRFSEYDYLDFPASGPDRWKSWTDPERCEYVCTLVYP